jgi:hypothetical protein
MDCAQQQLQQLTTDLQQLAIDSQPPDSSSSSTTTAGLAAAGFDKSKPSPGAAIGQLAVAAVQLGALQPLVIADVSKGSGFSGGPLGPGPSESDRLDFAAALVAAAGSAATAASVAALDAASASDTAFALTELKVQHPGLLLKLQEAEKKKGSATGLSVGGSLAAVTAAAAGSMSGSSSSVLMRLVRAVVAAEAQPGEYSCKLPLAGRWMRCTQYCGNHGKCRAQLCWFEPLMVSMGVSMHDGACRVLFHLILAQ